MTPIEQTINFLGQIKASIALKNNPEIPENVYEITTQVLEEYIPWPDSVKLGMLMSLNNAEKQSNLPITVEEIDRCINLLKYLQDHFS
ncbi:hypothetical protein [Piscirickettsia litoralis]|uniref:Uncharacterized protein n=1 Tax=Piscirickettsia litoralis TaxID=1891921 RepID=A0ABX3A1I3_9GAMM|nr:hypothetical protein [Piscirickettsia litoralis]ODN41305.1 hypothetical protein BGC07_17225 [Piscirickettsia litoralis]